MRHSDTHVAKCILQHATACFALMVHAYLALYGLLVSLLLLQHPICITGYFVSMHH